MDTMDCGGAPAGTLPFSQALAERGVTLTRAKTTALQVNMGLVCNLSCRHCHVEAGPRRTESMDEATVRRTADYAARGEFLSVDITGGAPELNPHLRLLIGLVRPHVQRIMIRTNLTLLRRPPYSKLIETFRENRVAVVASFPSVNQSQAEAQRGDGVFDDSVDALRALNAAGYGAGDTGLDLMLVVNPSGSFMAPPQEAVEKRFRETLARRWGITFTGLLAFSNVPLGRFGRWLAESGNLESYYRKLDEGFNPCALAAVMYRTQLRGWPRLLLRRGDRAVGAARWAARIGRGGASPLQRMCERRNCGGAECRASANSYIRAFPRYPVLQNRAIQGGQRD
ncbi:MAG: DUF3641 domain-containing protein [Nitrospinae bacterium]|nr:DUF3641 domain-containing protein [Nitrospinota bacterium]